MKILDENLGKNWKNYIWQGILAGLSIIVMTAILSDFMNFVSIAAIGSTAFVVFALPHTRTARLRNVIGGHFLCVIAGLTCSYLGMPGIEGGVAVAIGFCLMVVTNTEHPPAAGTALALAESPALSGALFIMASAVFYSGLRMALLSKLKNLAG